MEAISYDKYVERGKNASKMLDERAESLREEDRKSLEIEKISGLTLENIYDATGLKYDVDVANDNGSGVAAFVTVDDAKPYMVESSLMRPQVMNIAYHEKGHVDHLRNGAKEIKVKENLEGREYAELKEYMWAYGFDLDKVNLLEGFNEFDNARQHGVTEGCGYNDVEVPAAKLLEETCKRDTDRSLLEAFKSGRMDEFYELLKSLCAIMTVRKTIKMAA